MSASSPRSPTCSSARRLSGEFLQVNRYLINELKLRGLWTEDMRNRLKVSEGSIQNIDELPADLKLIYRTVWEVPMRALIEMAAARNAFIDQSQSLNLFCGSRPISAASLPCICLRGSQA